MRYILTLLCLFVCSALIAGPNPITQNGFTTNSPGTLDGENAYPNAVNAATNGQNNVTFGQVNSIMGGTLTLNGSTINGTGPVHAPQFIGGGANLTGVPTNAFAATGSTSGQVLTSTGSGTPPVFLPASGGGGGNVNSNSITFQTQVWIPTNGTLSAYVNGMYVQGVGDSIMITNPPDGVYTWFWRLIKNLQSQYNVIYTNGSIAGETLLNMPIQYVSTTGCSNFVTPSRLTWVLCGGGINDTAATSNQIVTAFTNMASIVHQQGKKFMYVAPYVRQDGGQTLDMTMAQLWISQNFSNYCDAYENLALHVNAQYECPDGLHPYPGVASEIADMVMARLFGSPYDNETNYAYGQIGGYQTLWTGTENVTNINIDPGHILDGNEAINFSGRTTLKQFGTHIQVIFQNGDDWSFYVNPGSGQRQLLFDSSGDIVLPTLGIYYGNGAGITNIAGVAGIVQTNISAATAGIAGFNYTVPGGVTNSYTINGYLTVTALSLDVIQPKIVWTDENGIVQSISLGSSISATGYNNLPTTFIRAKGGTVIFETNALTTGTGSITYNTEVHLSGVSSNK